MVASVVFSLSVAAQSREARLTFADKNPELGLEACVSFYDPHYVRGETLPVQLPLKWKEKTCVSVTGLLQKNMSTTTK